MYSYDSDPGLRLFDAGDVSGANPTPKGAQPSGAVRVRMRGPDDQVVVFSNFFSVPAAHVQGWFVLRHGGKFDGGKFGLGLTLPATMVDAVISLGTVDVVLVSFGATNQGVSVRHSWIIGLDEAGEFAVLQDLGETLHSDCLSGLTDAGVSRSSQIVLRDNSFSVEAHEAPCR